MYAFLFYDRIPDTSKVRQKMLYASSKEALRRNLVGLAIEIQGTDSSEVIILFCLGILYTIYILILFCL